MPFPPVNTQIACPVCRQPITIQVRQIIDVNEEPQLKRELLSNRLNAFTCPVCKNAGALASPFLYHDAEKELALLFIPMNINAREADQQKMIGRLTQQVLTNLAPEKRKAYLLRPQTMLTLQLMMEKVLEGEGITKEMMEASQQRLNLLQRLLGASSAEVRAEFIRQENHLLDERFFEILSRLVEASLAQGASVDVPAPAGYRAAQADFVPLADGNPTLEEVRAMIEEIECNVVFIDVVNYENHGLTRLDIDARLQGVPGVYRVGMDSRRGAVNFILPLTTYLAARIVEFQVTKVFPGKPAELVPWRAWDMQTGSNIVTITPEMIST